VKQQMEEQLKVQRAAAQAKRADDQNQGLLPTSIDASKLRGAVPINLPPTQRLVIKGKDGKTTTINQLNPSKDEHNQYCQKIILLSVNIPL